jgi:hypothetical protein
MYKHVKPPPSRLAATDRKPALFRISHVERDGYRIGTTFLGDRLDLRSSACSDGYMRSRLGESDSYRPSDPATTTRHQSNSAG